MPNLKQRIIDLRSRSPLFDHIIRMHEHYGAVNGGALAAAVTYFAFLSFFPILALAFAVIGQVSKAYPDAQGALVEAIGEVLPGMIGNGEGQISLDTLASAAPGIFSVGLLMALYSGLGWLSGMRQALTAVFEEPKQDQPNFVMGKLRDLLALVLLGSILLVSVAVSGVATKLTKPILDFLNLQGVVATTVLWVLALLLGVTASAVLFFAFFRVLASPDSPSRSLWSGALLGAVGFEALKQASTFLLQSTKNQPAFQAFGIALILLVWMYYFSRIVIYAAAWAHTTRASRELREARLKAEQTVEGPQVDLHRAGSGAAVRSAGVAGGGSGEAKPAEVGFAVGAAAMLVLVGILRRFSRWPRSSG